MKIPTIAFPVMRKDRLKGVEGLRAKGAGKITASLEIYNPATKRNCESACDRKNNFGTSRDSCVHECYWETDWWKSNCPGTRYC